MTTLLFDLDGNLVDSSPGILAAFRHSFAQMNWPCPDQVELMTFIGPPLETSFALFGDAAFVEKAVTIYKQHYEAGGVDQAALYSGIPEALEQLTQAGYPLYVATSKNEPMAVKMLKNLQIASYFRGVFGSLGNDHKADVLQRGIQTFSLTVDQAVMIGDTHFDMIGGQTVGSRL